MINYLDAEPDPDPDLLYATPEDMPALREEVKRLRRVVRKAFARTAWLKEDAADLAERLASMRERLARE